MAVILIVDDEEPIQELLKFNLEKEGYTVLVAYDGPSALKTVEEKCPDLVILDVMLPGMDGMEVCNQLRQNPKSRDIPVIMLTAKVEEIDKVLGLELGADDYLTKPFSPRELLARIRARLRRIKPQIQENELVRGDLKMDLNRFQVLVRGVEVELTPKEFELLRVLATHPGKVYSRDELLEQVWGYEYSGDTRTVDVHVRHLRQKVERDSSNPEYIETLRGIGYRLKG
ncbi:response regulator transcription factor [Desulfitobacterium metallireducens]|uniref:Stage 0 sporulation protein A homolog n=1 Tax=Desulfitobacterium metallireducens DSM 15288 TaxID=871968 RepID=W0EA40_9FIRM|nr:response regulator transcription factor [Desulfitobacterium metallireducens]AHF07705.1 PhoP family transcriptional regulator [Desulfitobacterium metallireducens DSM 15288]